MHYHNNCYPSAPTAFLSVSQLCGNMQAMPNTADKNVTDFGVVGPDLVLKDQDGSEFKVPLLSLIKLTKADGTPFNPLVDRIGGGTPDYSIAPIVPASTGMFMVTADGKKVALKEQLSSTGIPMGRFYLT